MRASCRWQGGLKFEGGTDDHKVTMDTMPPLGTNAGMSPKQLVLAGLCGCTAMDVAAWMKKHKQPLDVLEVAADATMTKGKEPTVFAEVALHFRLTGQIDREIALESVRLSQTRYCGVSAMLAKACPITYQIELNGAVIGSGKAAFPA